jgi:hypothetical protein
VNTTVLSPHLAVPPPGPNWTWPAGLLGLDLEEDGRGCVQHLTPEEVLGVVLEEFDLKVEEELCGV